MNSDSRPRYFNILLTLVFFLSVLIIGCNNGGDGHDNDPPDSTDSWECQFTVDVSDLNSWWTTSYYYYKVSYIVDGIDYYCCSTISQAAGSWVSLNTYRCNFSHDIYEDNRSISFEVEKHRYVNPGGNDDGIDTWISQLFSIPKDEPTYYVQLTPYFSIMEYGIGGQIFDQGGTRLSGVKIKLTGDATDETYSNSSGGWWSFNDLTAGEYWITPEYTSNSNVPYTFNPEYRHVVVTNSNIENLDFYSDEDQ